MLGGHDVDGREICVSNLQMNPGVYNELRVLNKALIKTKYTKKKHYSPPLTFFNKTFSIQYALIGSFNLAQNIFRFP
jgi:hypothetical protein